jgi:hypothetical protein
MINTTFDSYTFLRELMVSEKGMGTLLGRLVYEVRVRQEVRVKIRRTAARAGRSDGGA